MHTYLEELVIESIFEKIHINIKSNFSVEIIKLLLLLLFQLTAFFRSKNQNVVSTI